MLSARWSVALPFVVLGMVCMAAGGLLSAATALAPSEQAAWAVAYLVLVGGLAQAGLGAGQALLASEAPPCGVVIAEVLAWNLGNAAVLAGELLHRGPVVDVGGALLAAALVLLIRSTRRAAVRRRWKPLAFRGLVLLLAVSIPVGLVVGELRPR
jgi:hypothetical protein